MTYRPEIDGLRAFAVLVVIFFHAGFSSFSGGFVGVDVFFVISGFLITSIIVEEMARGRFSLVHFYERRARRILPALVFVVLCSIPLAWFILLDAPMRKFVQSIVATATFSSNFFFWTQSGYFDTSAELKPLLHTWSLAVEEQFYIIFPLILMVGWRFGLRRIGLLLGLLFVASFGFAEWGSRNAPSASFFLLPARGWELLVGAFCSLALRRATGPLLPPRPGGMLAAAGLALIAIAVVAFDSATPFPGIYALLPTLGTALIILFARPGTMAHRVLALRPFVAIGLISYSLYLWHQPLFAFKRHWHIEDVTPVELIPMIVLAFCLATISYFVVEQPFRHRGVIGRGLVFALSGTALAGLAVFGVIGHKQGGFNGRPLPAHFSVDIANYEVDNDALRKKSWSELTAKVKSLGGTGYSANQADWFPDDTSRLSMLVVGNSHSKDIYNILKFSETASRAMNIARYDTQIETAAPDLYGSSSYRRADVLMIASRYTPGDIDALPDLIRTAKADGKQVVIVKNVFEFPEFRQRSLTLADVTVLNAAGEGKRDPAEIARLSDSAYTKAFAAGPGESQFGVLNDAIQKIAAADPDVILLDRMEYICPEADHSCHSVSPELEKYFFDYGHHTMAGAKFFAGEVDAIGWLDRVLRMDTQKKPT